MGVRIGVGGGGGKGMTLIAIFWTATMRSRCHASIDILWSVLWGEGGGVRVAVVAVVVGFKSKVCLHACKYEQSKSLYEH